MKMNCFNHKPLDFAVTQNAAAKMFVRCGRLFAAASCIILIFSCAAGEAAAQSSANAPADDGTWWYVAVVLFWVAIGGVGYWLLRKRADKNEQNVQKNQVPVRPAANNQKNRAPQNSNAAKKTGNAVGDSPVSAKSNGNGASAAPVAASSAAAGKIRQPDFSTSKLQPAVNVASGGLNVNQGTVSFEKSQNSTDYMTAWQLSPPAPLEPLPESDEEALLEAIEQIREDEDDEGVRELAVRVLSAFKTANSVEALRQVALYDQSAKLRIEAVNALGSFDHEAVFELILLACADPSREVRAAAARTLTRLNFNRADAFVRVIESRDPERMRLASLACIEAGLANRAFERLTANDQKQAYEAFAILTLLVKSNEFEPILATIEEHPSLSVKLATIRVLHNLNPTKMQSDLKRLEAKEDLPLEVKTALGELIYHLSQTA